VLYFASQVWPAHLSRTNQVTFDQVNGVYSFSNQAAGPSPGSLTVVEGSGVGLDQASVGIGMSGSGTYAVQAQPNLQLTFTPHPVYWITFGNFTQGEVLDIQSLTNPAQINYPAGNYAMVATLNQDNTWTITTASDHNKSRLERRRQQRKS